MRRYFYTTILLLLPLMVMADTYTQLWKSVDQSQQKDQPKTALLHLQTITQKATVEHEWGHLVKAELMAIDVQGQITPDSVRPQLARFEAKVKKAEAYDAVLGAVYDCVMGHVYANIDSCKHLSKQYFAKATANLDLLAQEKAHGYEPLLVQGADSRIFGNDLLHVILFEAKEYRLANQYYREHGNEAAACMSMYYQIQKERFDDVREIHKSKYKARLDSLISEYSHLPEAGEVAIERFTFMDQATDASAQEKIEYIDYALRTWPTWPRMAVLKNARQRITLPSFHVQMPETSVVPDRHIPVYITSLVNLHRLNMTITKLKMTGAEEFNPSDENDMKKIRSLMAEKPIFSDSHDYYGLPDYKEVRDTLSIIPLPVGVYLVEFTTDNKEVPAERVLLHVSNLRLLDMDMPGRQVRLIAVNATTGKPLSGAKITLQYRRWEKGKLRESEEILTTAQNGEVKFSPETSPWRYRVSTQRDNAMCWEHFSTSWNEKDKPRNNNKAQSMLQVYTDRALYRPGQTVHASFLTYVSDYYQHESNVLACVPLTISLRNSSGKVLDTVEAKTDEWGVAAADFTLPENKETGMFNIVATSKEGERITGRRYVRVEEYKRPTFSVTIDDYEKPYKVGDTITVRGWAKTYAGVPVQNATVTYSAVSRAAHWWIRYFSNGNGQEVTYCDEVKTREDGSFEMRLPIIVNEAGINNKFYFYECGLNVDVASLAGESHHAQRYFRVSNKETMLVLDDFSENQCLENLQKAQFTFVNNAGTPVSENVSYSIDNGIRKVVNANEPLLIDFSGIEKGRHTLRAYCQNDSLEKTFVLFSLDDERPVIDTDGWSYDAPGLYNEPFNFVEGEPVRIQIGTSRDDQTVFYAIISETEVLEEGTLTLNNSNHNRSFTYKEEWGEGIAMRYSWARNGKVYSFAERLHKPVKSNELQLEWTSFRDKVAPGQKEEWTINIKGVDGKPASAHMIATIYDKSMEELAPHSLPLNIAYYSFTPYIFSSQRNLSSQQFLYGEQHYRPLDEPSLLFYSFAIPSFMDYQYAMDEVFITGATPRKLFRSAKPLAMKNAELGVQNAESAMITSKAARSSVQMDMAVADVVETPAAEEDFSDVQLRENLNETAAFMPLLTTDKDGNVSIKFTLPDDLTTWRFLGLAHDKQMNNGQITGDAVSQKPLMVKPNMPRFLREGDKTAIVATIANTTRDNLSGTATMQLLNAETEKVVYQTKSTFDAEADNTVAVSFDVPSTLAADVYICKIIAKTKTLSDGEQQLLPVISKKELVVTTRAITQTKAGKKTVNLNELFGKNTQNEKVSIEYTNNPAWLMVDALPAAIKDCDGNDNAVNFSTAVYAATLALELKNSIASADLNVDTLNAKKATYIEHLKALQNEDGSFSWYPNMPGSPYITLEVARNFVRLEHMLGTQSDIEGITKKAMSYLASCINKEVNDLKREQSRGVKKPMPSELAMDYLYLQAIRDGKMGRTDGDNVRYLLSLLKDVSKELTIYGKSNLALAFALSQNGGDKKKADELLESVMQYSVATEEMGRYFDTPKAHYSWRNYKIPTETAVIEALQVLHPTDGQSIAEMRQWLLNEKRTQLWDTPVNTTSAIYAFLNGNMTALDDVAEPTKIFLDGKTLLTSGKERGFFKTTEVGRHKQVVFDKRQDGMSFGAVITEAMQSVDDVKGVNDNSLHVKREVIAPSENLKVGDKVTVRITLSADRDMDFVEVEDNRAACLEPVQQLSGYRYGCFVSPRDTKTVYSFHTLAKGRPVVIETEYYVDRKGTFESGLITARCAYAPEFSARGEAMVVNVE